MLFLRLFFLFSLFVFIYRSALDVLSDVLLSVFLPKCITFAIVFCLLLVVLGMFFHALAAVFALVRALRVLCVLHFPAYTAVVLELVRCCRCNT